MEHHNYIFNIGTCLVCHEFFWKYVGDRFIFIQVLLSSFMWDVLHISGVKYSFLVVKVLPVGILFLLFLYLKYILFYNILPSNFSIILWLWFFLINRGCDNHIIIILVNYFAVKNNCWLYMYKKNLLDMTMNTFTRTFKAVWKLLKLRIKFVLVNPRINTWYVLNDR